MAQAIAMQKHAANHLHLKRYSEIRVEGKLELDKNKHVMNILYSKQQTLSLI